MSQAHREQLAKALTDYAEALHQHGALEGESGCKHFEPEVRKLLDAIHKVLSGATVKRLDLDESKVNQKTVHELANAVEKSLEAFNRIIPDPGKPFYG